MASPSRSVLTALLLGACSADLESVSLPLDPTKSAVLLTVAKGGPPRVHALDFPDGSPAKLDVSAALDADLFLYAYQCSLAATGLRPGEVPLSDGGEALPRAHRTLTTTISGGRAAPWRDAGTLPPAVTSLRVERQRPSRCVEYAFDVRPLEASFQSAALLGEDQLVLVLDTGIFVYRLPGFDMLMAWPDNLWSERHGAIRDPSGGVVIAASSGRIDRVSPTLEHDIQRVSTGTTTRFDARIRVAYVVGPAVGSSELYMVSERGRLDRFDGATWRTLFDNSASNERKYADVATLTYGQAIAVGLVAGERLDVRGDMVERARVLDRGGNLARVLLHPSQGPIFFTSDGRAVLRRGEQYVEVPMMAVGQRPVIDVLATEIGFLAAASEGGQIAQFDLEQGECPTVLVGLMNTERMVPFRDKIYVFGVGFGDEPAVSTLTLTHAPERCD